MTGQAQGQEGTERRPDPGVAARPVLWLALGVLLLLAGSLAVSAAIFELSATRGGPDRVAVPAALPLQGVRLEEAPAPPPAATPPPAALRQAMAAVAARPRPLAPLTAAERDRFRAGRKAAR